MIDINLSQVVKDKIENCRKNIGYNDPRRHYVLDEAWFKRKEAELLATGETKLKEMLERAEELGYKITSAKTKDFGLIFLKAERDGTILGGYADPLGKMKLGLERTKTLALQISYRKKLNHKELFLTAILKDSGFRR